MTGAWLEKILKMSKKEDICLNAAGRGLKTCNANLGVEILTSHGMEQDLYTKISKYGV